MGEIQSRPGALQVVQSRLKGKPYNEQLEAALSRSKVDPDYFKTCLVSTLRKNPDLLSCDPASLLAASIEAAATGLVIDGVLGHAYLVKFGREATFMPGYRGYVQKGYEAGAKRIQGFVVHEGDDLDIQYGMAPAINHTPRFKSDEIQGAYTVAELADGTVMFHYMPVGDIEKVKAKARSRGGPWSDPASYPWMCIKTTTRALFKWLPLQTDIQRMAMRDEQIEAGALLTEREVEAELVEPDALGEVMETVKEREAPADEPEFVDDREMDDKYGDLFDRDPDEDPGEDVEPIESLPPDPSIPAAAWNSASPSGGYEYPIDLDEPFEDWIQKGIGSRKRVFKDKCWFDIEAGSLGHLELRNIVDARRRLWAKDKDVQPTPREKMAYILLKVLDAERAKEKP